MDIVTKYLPIGMTDLQKKIGRILPWLVIGIPIGASLIETITYPGLLQVWFGIHLHWLVLYWLGGMALAAIILKRPVWPASLSRWIIYPYLLSALVLVMGTWAENTFYLNYVFATWGINLLGVLHLTGLLLGFGALALVFNRGVSWRGNRLFIFITPVVVLTCAYFLQTLDYVFFRWLVQEDGPVETAQVVILLIAVYCSLKLFIIHKAKDRLMAGLMLLAFAGLIFITGEEISWGQRIFQWDTPEHFAEINMQRETNVHNLEQVFATTIRLYILITFYGAFAWIFAPLVSRFWPAERIAHLVPSGLLMGYFVPSLVYNIYRVVSNIRPMDRWEETTELLLYMGIMLHMIRAYRLNTRSAMKHT